MTQHRLSGECAPLFVIFFSFVAMLSMAALLKLGYFFCWRLSGLIRRLTHGALDFFALLLHTGRVGPCGTALFHVFLSLGFPLGSPS